MLLLFFSAWVLCSTVISQLTCPEKCDLSKCPAFNESDCSSGATQDHCECCPICAQGEGEPCDLEAVKTLRGYSGSCGDNLKCVERTDIPDNIKEGVCQCLVSGEVCGSDNITYSNFCQIKAFASDSDAVTFKHKGRCLTGSQITNVMENIEVVESNKVTLTCEVYGNPVPYVWWEFVNIDGKSISLPGDDERISVSSRGGSQPYTVASWLLIQEAQNEHEGDYTCHSKNSLGEDVKQARVKVIKATEL